MNVPLANNKFPADERWNRWVEESEKSRMIQVTDRYVEPVLYKWTTDSHAFPRCAARTHPHPRPHIHLRAHANTGAPKRNRRISSLQRLSSADMKWTPKSEPHTQ